MISRSRTGTAMHKDGQGAARRRPSFENGVHRGVVTGYPSPFERDGERAGAIAPILALLAESLNVGATLLSRISGAAWEIEQVHDRTGVGVQAGITLPLADTYCGRMIVDQGYPLIVPDVRSHAYFGALPITRQWGVGAYSGVPLYRGTGQLYGTLTTLHPRARGIPDNESMLLMLAARLMMQTVGAELPRQDLTSTGTRLRTIYTTACGIVVLNQDGVIIDVDGAAQEMLGRNLDELRGRVYSPSLGRTTGESGDVAATRPAEGRAQSETNER